MSKKISIFPKCSIATGFGWVGFHLCGKPAVFRNRFGGYECQEHHDLNERVMSSPTYTKQPDEYFNPGVIGKTIDGRTLFGKLRLMLSWIFRNA